MAITRTFLLLLLSLLTLSATLPTSLSSASNHTELQAAIEDMRSRSFYGFAILLQMLNSSVQQSLQDITFFVPADPELSNISISAEHLEDFLLSHSVSMPLQFNDLIHFPTGSMVPSGARNKMIRIHNHGRGRFVLNNAEVTVPNVCSSSDTIKCHGVNAVVEFGNESDDDRN